MIDAYVSLGSNLQNPQVQVQQAIAAIAALPETTLIAASSLYSSKPLGPDNQPDFVNAVAKVATALSPEKLLQCLHTIEDQQGRVRGDERWGPRTIDCDILLYGDEVINTVSLTVPHYDLAQREFVLIPLLEIAADLRLPSGESIDDVLAQCPRSDSPLTKIAEVVS